MYLLEALKLLRRRWITCVVGLALTIGACVAVSSVVKPEHQATSRMMFLLPPDATGTERPSNPYLNLPDGMWTTANLLAGVVSSQDVADDLADEGADAEYTVTVATEAGPVIDIVATSTDADTALLTRDRIMELIDQELAQVQADASTPENQIMTATRPTVSRTAEPLMGGVYQAIGGTLVAGLLLMLVSAFVVDRLSVRRRRRAAARASAAAAPEPPEEGTAETTTSVAPEVEPEPVAEDEPMLDFEPVAEEPAPAARPVKARKPKKSRQVPVAAAPVAAVEESPADEPSESDEQATEGPELTAASPSRRYRARNAARREHQRRGDDGSDVDELSRSLAG